MLSEQKKKKKNLTPLLNIPSTHRIISNSIQRRTSVNVSNMHRMYYGLRIAPYIIGGKKKLKTFRKTSNTRKNFVILSRNGKLKTRFFPRLFRNFLRRRFASRIDFPRARALCGDRMSTLHGAHDARDLTTVRLFLYFQ